MSLLAKCGSAFRQLFLRRTGLSKRNIHPNTITIQTCCQRDTESDDKNSVEVLYGAPRSRWPDRHDGPPSRGDSYGKEGITKAHSMPRVDVY